MNTGKLAGSVSAFDKRDISNFIDNHSTMLYRFCRSLTYNIEDAEDLFQEIWFAVLSKPQKLHNAKNPKVFIYNTAVYLWKSQQRKYARRKRLAPDTILCEELDSGVNLEEDLLRQSEKEYVRDLINELSDKYRIPILLYYSLEFDISKIAEILNIPSGTVKSRLFYARNEIKKGWLKYENPKLYD